MKQVLVFNFMYLSIRDILKVATKLRGAGEIETEVEWKHY